MPRTRQAVRPPNPSANMYPPVRNGAPQYHPMPQPGTNMQQQQMQQQPQQYYDGIYPGYGRSTPPTGNWANGNGMMQHQMDGYQNAMAGPSRPTGEYQPFQRAPPPGMNHDTSPLPPGPRRPPPSAPPPGAGWSSVHPSASSHQSSVPMPRNQGMPTVKLEDLVADAPRSAMNGHPHSAIPGGLTSIPLSVAQQEAKAAAAQGGAGESSSQGPSEFIKKLYKMLEEESIMFGNVHGVARGDTAKHGAVGWGKGGTSFVVWEMNDFTTKILPQTFRHSNFSSFVRQLNKYGFSKIKHVDEDTGQIKENVWEFQHPNFQAGGKSDLDSIKRKAPVPKKGGGEDRDSSPSRGLGAEEMGRIMEMESRLLSLEDRLHKTEEALSAAKSREIGVMGLMREVISQLGNMEKESTTPSGDAPTPRILRLYQSFDQIAQTITNDRPYSANAFTNPNPSFNSVPSTANMVRFASDTSAAAAHISPHTDSSSRSKSDGEHPSPAGSTNNPGQTRKSASTISEGPEDIIELGQNQGTNKLPNQSFVSDQYGMSNMFTDPSWFTGIDGGPFMPVNPRKSSDGTTLRMMAEALAAQSAIHGDTQDPLDTSPRPGPSLDLNSAAGNVQAQSTGINGSTIAQSPFGTLIIPPQAEGQQGDAIRLRRSTVIKPSWTQTPKILVVEDDVVYRQLSRKFLEKFGCQIEVVENAQVAIERMNKTKYDLVLMDIFFGPHMDGRKATSLIRQFDMYTPIISMTSNAKPQDVDSYLQSGMTDVLAKPFTKHGLFGILDKHLIHLKAIQLSGEVPRFIGVPPLSDQGLVDAMVTGAAQWGMGMGLDESWRNPLVGMGWSDETYQLVLQQFMQTGSIPDVNSLSDTVNNAIGTNVVFGDSAGYNRKRSIESPGDDWMDEDRDIKKARNDGGIIQLS